MSQTVQSPLYNEEEVPSTSNSSWKPFSSSRRPSLLPHPSDLTATSEVFVPRQTEYAFPARNSAPWSFNPDIASAPMLPEVSEEPYYRQYRSMSLSFGQPDLFSPSTSSTNQFLNTIMQEDDEEEEYRFERTRSKSSAAIMDIWNTPLSNEIEDAKWLAVHHRTNTARSLLTPPDTTSERRFSLAPSISLLESNSSLLNQRRHSLAGPSMMMNSILELESLNVRERNNNNNNNNLPAKEIKIDDMGKGTRLDSELLKEAIFYVVEFKGGRWDVFYSQEQYKKTDLVIVEADRGHDLGKVTMENITRQQLEVYYTLLKNVNHNTGELIEDQKVVYQSNEIYIKCIFRKAITDEITLLMAKGQDESKALMVCQSKIKQKKLNMQVVDAEYQWDRRKLTFYFIAEKRVDFRELVRELFKLYKTRIWM
ncbi:PSP1 C-terminal conserved region-domain-containing protein [Thamnidium elegans]|nr:PSP1 C-terminal conserved region-domain-containing protein [Thamnidium elegans]